MEWSDEQTSSFIEMYRERSLLWDPTNGLYKNKNKRHDALMEIAVSFGISKIKVEKKIKNLQSQFAREKKKEKSSLTTTGSGADETYTSRWFAYKSLLFLADKNTHKNTQDAEGSKNQNDQDKHENRHGSENVDNGEGDPTEVGDDEAAAKPVIKNAVTSPKKPAKKKKKLSVTSPSPFDTPIVDEALSLLRTIQNKKSKDEYDLFGEQVAIQLRKITSPHARFMAQQNINRTLFDAQMGMGAFWNTSQQAYNDTYHNMYPSGSGHRKNETQLSPYPSPPPPIVSSPSSSSSTSYPVSQDH